MAIIPEVRIRAPKRSPAGAPAVTFRGVYLDGRTAEGRRYRAITEAVTADLGGDDELTETQRLLIGSIASTAVLKEQFDCKILAGKHPIDTGEY
jgi:hypothetical protein